MKNKNAILIELAVHTVAVLFRDLYFKDKSVPDLSNVSHVIEEECVRQANLSFNERDRITDGDIHMMKMYAKNYYEQYFSKILEERLKRH